MKLLLLDVVALSITVDRSEAEVDEIERASVFMAHKYVLEFDVAVYEA